jgi:hypothetical protein
MEKELHLNNRKRKVLIQMEDLKFDGKNIIIPSYWDSVISDYLERVDTKGMNDADKDDFIVFRNFFLYLIDYKSDEENKNSN